MTEDMVGMLPTHGHLKTSRRYRFICIAITDDLKMEKVVVYQDMSGAFLIKSLNAFREEFFPLKDVWP
jgi:hypothetical protein